MTSSEDFGDNDLSGINSIRVENDITSTNGRGIFAGGVSSTGSLSTGYRAVSVSPDVPVSSDTTLGIGLAPCAVNLPVSSTFGTGAILIIKDELGLATGPNPITITSTVPETIDGAATAVINTAFGVVKLQVSSTGNWMVI